MGIQSVWEISVPSSQFCSESKTALKNKALMKKQTKNSNVNLLYSHGNIFKI